MKTPEQWAKECQHEMKLKFAGERFPDTDEMILDCITSAIRSAVAEALSAGLPGTPLDTEGLAAIQERVEKATEGPWGIQPDSASGKDEAYCYWHRVGPLDLTGRDPDADSVFIAHARADIPALLAHVAHLEGILRDLASDGPLDHYRRGYTDGQRDWEKIPVPHGVGMYGTEGT